MNLCKNIVNFSAFYNEECIVDFQQESVIFNGGNVDYLVTLKNSRVKDSFIRPKKNIEFVFYSGSQGMRNRNEPIISNKSDVLAQFISIASYPKAVAIERLKTFFETHGYIF